MLRKNQRSSSLSGWQVQQLKRISPGLRKLNRDARRELRRIGYTSLTRKQYRESGDLLGTIATRMIGALRFRDEILKAEPEQRSIRLTVRFVTPCVHHIHRSESRQLRGHDDDEAARQALKQDPAHQEEIEPLLELTNSVEDLVSRRSRSRREPPDEFFRGINRLRLAVLQQQQYLVATAPRRPLVELKIADGPDICADCLKSKEIDSTMDGHERQV